MLLCQDPTAEIDRLIGELADDLIEIRERAQHALIRIGMPAVPALKKAAEAKDAEVAVRARRIWLVIDRSERELDHDAREMRKLLSKLHPDFLEQWKDRPLKFEGSNFSVSATLTTKGVFIGTESHHLLMRYESGIMGGLSFDLASLQDASGSIVEVERCANCSPGIMLAKRQDAGPLKARFAGVQTWFSRYPLEFDAPRNGQVQEVGDMTVEIAWPVIKVTSKKGWHTRAVRLGRYSFDFDLKPGARSERPRIGIGVLGGGCGAGPARPRPGWCSCETGPVDPGPKKEPPLTYSIELKAQTGNIPLEDVERIRCAIFKPLEIPIDFTVELRPPKREE